jgi:hypothetical protein
VFGGVAASSNNAFAANAAAASGAAEPQVDAAASREDAKEKRAAAALASKAGDPANAPEPQMLDDEQVVFQAVAKPLVLEEQPPAKDDKGHILPDQETKLQWEGITAGRIFVLKGTASGKVRLVHSVLVGADDEGNVTGKAALQGSLVAPAEDASATSKKPTVNLQLMCARGATEFKMRNAMVKFRSADLAAAFCKALVGAV